MEEDPESIWARDVSKPKNVNYVADEEILSTKPVDIESIARHGEEKPKES